MSLDFQKISSYTASPATLRITDGSWAHSEDKYNTFAYHSADTF